MKYFDRMRTMAPLSYAAQDISCPPPYASFQGIALGTQEEFLCRNTILCLGFDMRIGKGMGWPQVIKCSTFLFILRAKHCAWTSAWIFFFILTLFSQSYEMVGTINISKVLLISLVLRYCYAHPSHIINNAPFYRWGNGGIENVSAARWWCSIPGSLIL